MSPKILKKNVIKRVITNEKLGMGVKELSKNNKQISNTTLYTYYISTLQVMIIVNITGCFSRIIFRLSSKIDLATLALTGPRREADKAKK